ncbi:MAG: EAL domain-containing protein [Gemmatimonadota bacterium]
MNKKVAVALALVTGLIAISVPISISLFLAWKQSFNEQMATVASLAQDVLRRSEESTDQTFIIFKALASAHSADPCSAENIRLMGKLDLASEQVQAVGYVRDNRLLCSSYGHHDTPIGPPTYVTRYGTAIRTSVEFPVLPGERFLVSTDVASGYTVAIHPSLPLNVFVGESHLSIGVVSDYTRSVILHRGVFEPEWIELAGGRADARFSDGGSLVTVKHSPKYGFSAYAAVSTASVNAGLRRFALVLVPIGVLAGIVLAWAVVYLARQQLALPAVLKVALKRNEFFLEYQPVVDLSTGRWVGAEALIRWRRPNGELIRPDVFIAVAEEINLIQRVTERVMAIIADDVQDLLAHHPGFHIAINLSAADLQSEQTLVCLDTLRGRISAGPGNLIVEVTERVFMKAEAVRSVLDEIRGRGIEIAIDDFGTGYSSLSYLESVKLDYLKIDKCFVETLEKEAATSQVVPHIIEMAKSLNLKMVAEGVETEVQAQYLRQRGVQFAQGWLFARPMPFAEFVRTLRKAEEESSASAA